MGRPPTHGAPSFRFHPAEVAHMEAVLRDHGGHVPAREHLVELAQKFSNSPERAGKITVQMKQVWNWFQNRRYALRSKLVKSPNPRDMPPNPRDEVAVAPLRMVPPAPQQTLVPSGHNVIRNASENPPMEFEAKSARDGAWYDVQAFLSHRYLETGNPTVTVLEAEKVGSSEPSEPTMPVSTAITDGDPTVSKMEESSNVNVSAEHTNGLS
ncbi:hypothetical protein BVRB_016700 [Beta vulgaris subsp. vulgaris]|uniref:Homeobox domain-containing protein n=1 Tax=Beta vulgaris subsp. vulgaris TaxID=3555 RepID=A0A0J8B465_BETVV|nr:protein SAWADEE HOMEODOMAIN HOMOLOG 2 [Beta vulgaris subsp. vulgaris]KMS94643.1 hypothetical protein BVRB_016700 [Beta vulgaris subsp. vulgaris]